MSQEIIENFAEPVVFGPENSSIMTLQRYFKAEVITFKDDAFDTNISENKH